MRKLLSLAVLALLVSFMASCNKDDETGNQLSKNEAQAELNALNSETIDDLDDLANAEGFSALRSLFDLTELDDPFAGRTSSDKQRIKNYFRKKGNELRTIFIKKANDSGRINSDEPFDFNGHKGIYEWDFETQAFQKTGSSTIIEIHYPTDGSVTNNATLKITAYSEVELYDQEFEYSYFEPEMINASLTVNGEEVALLDLNIDWSQEGFPLTADITLELVPFSGNLSFDVSGSMVSTMSASILHNDDIVLATFVTVNYDNASKSEESIETLTGFVQVQDVKLDGEIDVEAMDQSSDGDPNEYVHLALFTDDTKLGDIVFEEDDGEWIPYLQYADGSKEELDEVLEPILDKLDDLESDFSDDNG